MIDFFSERIGVPYAYPRYSQITVAEFIFGGMENTTATTLTDLVLLDERAALDHDVDGLVSHELAHQWWGDLLTCREWSEAWLNEGFATYFEYVWREHAKGRDEADLELLVDADGYLNEAGRYQRPVVCRQYDEPIHLFDAHLYEKGGRVLHMLRHELGDAAFWRAIAPLRRANTRTDRSRRGISRAPSRRRPGATSTSCSTAGSRGRAIPSWRDAGSGTKTASWARCGSRRSSRSRPRRRRSSSRPRSASRSTGASRTNASASREATHAFELRLPARPTQVIFDPGDVVLKSIRLEKNPALWRRQLAAARLAIDRVAGRARPRPASRSGRHRRAGGGAARRRLLGRAGRGRARARPHPARRRARRAGGRRRRQASACPPRRRRRAGRVPGRRAGRAHAGRPPAPAATPATSSRRRRRWRWGGPAPPRRWRCCRRCCDRPSYQDVIRSRAIEGLGTCGDERAFPIIRDAWRAGAPWVTAAGDRRGAGRAGARHRHRARRPRIHRDAAGRSRLPGARRGGRGARAPRVDRGDRRAARGARCGAGRTGAPADGGGDPRPRGGHAARTSEMRHLHDEVERLRGETAKLRERLDRLAAQPATPATPPPTPPAPKNKRPAPSPAAPAAPAPCGASTPSDPRTLSR